MYMMLPQEKFTSFVRIQTFTYFDIVIFWNALHIIVLILKQKLRNA